LRPILLSSKRKEGGREKVPNRKKKENAACPALLPSTGKGERKISLLSTIKKGGGGQQAVSAATRKKKKKTFRGGEKEKKERGPEGTARAHASLLHRKKEGRGGPPCLACRRGEEEKDEGKKERVAILWPQRGKRKEAFSFQPGEVYNEEKGGGKEKDKEMVYLPSQPFLGRRKKKKPPPQKKKEGGEVDYRNSFLTDLARVEERKKAWSSLSRKEKRWMTSRKRGLLFLPRRGEGKKKEKPPSFSFSA